MKRLYVLFLVVFGFLFLINAQASNKFTVGVVDFQKILTKAPQVEQAKKKLIKQFAPQQKKLANKHQLLKKLMDDYHKNSPIMKKSELKKAQNKIQEVNKDIIKTTKDYQQKMMSTKQKSMSNIFTLITKTVTKIAKQKKLDIVMPKESLLYVGSSVNITSDVLKAL